MYGDAGPAEPSEEREDSRWCALVVDPQSTLLIAAPFSPHPCVAQILAARSDTPSEHYRGFMEQLTHTVRDDIADCAAASYVSLTAASAQKMFKFESQQELAEYLRDKRVRRGWCMQWSARAV